MKLEINLKYYRVSWDDSNQQLPRATQILVGPSANHVREVIKEAYPHVWSIKVTEVKV